MHLAVAAVVSALTAGCVEDDLPVKLARRGIEMDLATFHFKLTVDGVQGVAERKLRIRLCRIALQRHGLRAGGRNKSESQ